MQDSMRVSKRFCYVFSFQRFLLLVAIFSVVMFSCLLMMGRRNDLQCILVSTSPHPTEDVSCDRCILETPYAITPSDERLDIKKLKHPRWDYSRTYKIYDFVLVGDDFTRLTSSYKVSLASQTSIERLTEFLPGATHWTGPISLAVFVVGEEFIQLKGFVFWLSLCRPEIYHRIALHIVIPSDKVVLDGDMPDWSKDCEIKPLPPGTRSPDIIAWKAKNVYPQNHLRNVARKNCDTPYVFLVDIDIVPSIAMAESLDRFLRMKSSCAKCAYVIPTYELDFKVPEFPRNKSALLKLVTMGLALPFHNKVFLYNSYASNFSRWQNTKRESSEVHVSHTVTNYEFFYEPFYVALDNVPPHDERFVGYGFTRNTQPILEQLNWHNKGINVNGQMLSHLRFADDIVLLSESPTQLQSMINQLNSISRQIVLELNRTKTKVMTNTHKLPITVEETQVEYVDEYIYLGKQISLKNSRNI